MGAILAPPQDNSVITTKQKRLHLNPNVRIFIYENRESYP